MSEKIGGGKSDFFLLGNIVSLRLPDTEKDVEKGVWASWFNDLNITRYLEHGVFPVSNSQECALVEKDLLDSSKIVLSIVQNHTEKLLGVISLNNIDHLNGRCEIAIVTGNDKVPGAALEAMSLLTSHAFDRLNMNKIYAGQHEGLWKWVNTLGLIGYRVEGYIEDWGVRDGKRFGKIVTGISSSQYYKIKNQRKGRLIDCEIMEFMRRRKRKNPLGYIKRALNNI